MPALDSTATRRRATITRPVLFFDGVCNLCNGTVDFFVRHGSSNRLMFASLQGKTAAELLDPDRIHKLETLALRTVEGTYTQSDAVIRAAAYLRRPWSWIRVLRFIPKDIRDSLYRWVARNRYKWFGQRALCRVPSEQEAKRFLS